MTTEDNFILSTSSVVDVEINYDESECVVVDPCVCGSLESFELESYDSTMCWDCIGFLLEQEKVEFYYDLAIQTFLT